MSITVDTRQATNDLRRAMLFLSEAEIKKATNRAINHTLGVARTAVSKEIRSVYKIAAGDVREQTEVKRSSTVTLTGMIKANAAPLSLSKFNPVAIAFGRGGVLTETRRHGGRRGGFASSFVTRLGWNAGVTIEVLKGQKERLPSAFLLHAASGNATVMARGAYDGSSFGWDKPRLPINKLNSKSIYWASQNSGVTDKVMRDIGPKYQDRLLKELTSGLRYGR